MSDEIDPQKLFRLDDRVAVVASVSSGRDGGLVTVSRRIVCAA
jgi:hypothetical protein